MSEEQKSKKRMGKLFYATEQKLWNWNWKGIDNDLFDGHGNGTTVNVEQAGWKFIMFDIYGGRIWTRIDMDLFRQALTFVLRWMLNATGPLGNTDDWICYFDYIWRSELYDLFGEPHTTETFFMVKILLRGTDDKFFLDFRLTRQTDSFSPTSVRMEDWEGRETF